jgi:hypothetical protein
VVASTKLAEEGGEELTPHTIIGWVEFQGDGKVSFDVDGGERGGRIGRSGRRKGSSESGNKSRGGIRHDLVVVVTHGRGERSSSTAARRRVLRPEIEVAEARNDRSQTDTM